MSQERETSVFGGLGIVSDVSGSFSPFASEFFFFKQKTAYEFVSRDWSSDVCSSDLVEFLNFMDADRSAYFADIDPDQNPVLYRMVDTAEIGRASCRERV